MSDNMDVQSRLSLNNADFIGPLEKAAAVSERTAAQIKKAQLDQAKVVDITSKNAGDAVTERSLRIVAALNNEMAVGKQKRVVDAIARSGVLDDVEAGKAQATMLQAITRARLETAEATKIATIATEGHARAQLSDMQATSATVRALEGQQGIRAVERFITTIPGAGAAMKAIFPLVGGAMFIGMLVKMGTEVYELEQKGKHAGEEMSRAFGAMNEKLETSNDELALTNSRLEDQIAKIAGHPSNGLTTALLEAKLQADKLQESLAGDVKTLQELLKNQDVGRLEAFFSDTANTRGSNKDITDKSKVMERAGDTADGEQDKQLASAQAAHNRAIAQAGSNKQAIKAADDAFAASQLAAQHTNQEARAQAAESFAREMRAGADQVVKDQAESDRVARTYADGVHKNGRGGTDMTAKRTSYEDAAVMGDRIARRARLGESNLTDTSTLGSAQQKKDAEELAKKGTAEVNKAAADRLKAMEAQLHQEQLQQSMTTKGEYDFWDARRNVFKAGSDQYNEIVAKQAQLAETGAKTAHEQILRFIETQKHESLEPSLNGGDPLLGWKRDDAKLQNEKRDSSNELYALQKHTAAQLQELQVHEAAGRTMTQMAAATELAAIHTREYGAQLDELRTKQQAIRNLPKRGPEDVLQDQRQIDDLQKRIEQMQGGRQIQIAQDKYATGMEGSDPITGATEALQEFTRGAIDASAGMKSFLTSGINDTNAGLVKMLTEPHWKHRGQWGEIGHNIATTGTSSLLKGAEGSALKALGIGKVDGSSQASALWVRMAAAIGAGGSAAASAAKTAGGALSSWIGPALQFAGFAEGGDTPVNSPYWVGEKGPELRFDRSPGTVVPTNKIGAIPGDQHTWNIDARGATDPAQVNAAIMAAAPHIAAAAVARVQQDRLRSSGMGR